MKEYRRPVASHGGPAERLERQQARLQMLAGARLDDGLDVDDWEPEDVLEFRRWLPADARDMFSAAGWWRS